MPYVKQGKREILDKVVELMTSLSIEANGDLNYILYSYCKKNLVKSYNNIKNYCAELNECSEEIRRRILSEYEDQKIIENGDIL